MDSNDFVTIVVFMVVIGAPVAAWIISRVLAHNERMEMIRRGFVPPPDLNAMRKAMKYSVKYGAKMGFQPGSMPPPGYVPPASYDPDYYAQHQLRRGIQVAFVGLALLIGLSFIGFDNGRVTYGPWLLGGLVPMFVGIAQVISALLSGARIGGVGVGVGVGSTNFGPPEGGEAAPSATTAAGTMPPPPPGSYGGWRPGATPEIGKPPSPPDYRA